MSHWFCVNGYPKCKAYLWTKVEDDDVVFPRLVQGTNSLRFRMEKKNEGKYQCTCENDFGRSEPSAVAALWFLNDTSASRLPL